MARLVSEWTDHKLCRPKAARLRFMEDREEQVLCSFCCDRPSGTLLFPLEKPSAAVSLHALPNSDLQSGTEEACLNQVKLVWVVFCFLFIVLLILIQMELSV